MDEEVQALEEINGASNGRFSQGDPQDLSNLQGEVNLGFID